MNNSVLLLFPPMTEARLFPYLSLPMLTAYLRQQGVPVRQRDLNLELSCSLLKPEAIRRYRDLHTRSAHAGVSLHQAYRAAYADFLLERSEQIQTTVFRKAPETTISKRVVRIARQGMDLLVEGSLLKRQIHSLAELEGVARGTDVPAPNDLAASLLRDLLARELANTQPSVIGISIPYFSQILPSLLICRWIRVLAPQALVVLGGPQMMNWGTQLAALPFVSEIVDAIAEGPGEETLLRLYRHQTHGEPKEGIPQLRWLKGAPSAGTATAPVSRLQLKDLPPPDFSDLPLGGYLNPEAQAPLITTVGCSWGRCAFCSYGNRSRKKRSYQQATPEQIAEACLRIVREHGIHRINFVDENTNLRLVLSAVRIVNERGVRIRFSTRNRLEPSLLDPEFCRELAQRGCALMSVGYETNSQRLLDKLDKGLDASTFQPIIDNLHDAGIPLRLSVMGGILDETAEEFSASRDFLKSNSARIGIDVMQMLVVEPGTYLDDAPADFGLTIDRSRLQGNDLLSYGQGRMGWAYDAPGSEASFAVRQERFASLFEALTPAKNDEVVSEAQDRLPDDRVPLEIACARLEPWTKVLGQGSEQFLADLIWQRFYRIPAGIRASDDLLEADASTDEATRAAAKRFLSQMTVRRAVRA